MSKKRVLNFLAGKLWPRTSMSWILLATIAGGMLFSKAMHMGGIDTPAYRYAIAVLCSYVLFFALIYLWLTWHFGRRSKNGSHSLDAIDAVDLLTTAVSFPTSPPKWEGHGGGFSGGGASGSWESAPAATQVGANPMAAASESESPSAFGKIAGGAADADEGAIFVLLVAVIVGICAGGAYLVYQAPEILTEAALQAALAAGLFKKTKGIKAEGWAYPIFAKTWFIFLFVLICSALLGAAITHSCPEATSFKEYKALCR